MPRKINLEVCESLEWYQVFSSFDLTGVKRTLWDEAAGKFARRLHERLEDAGYETEAAQGQRASCHGWHGAQFRHSFGFVATFDRLTPAQIDQIEKIVSAAKSETTAQYKILSAELQAEELAE